MKAEKEKALALTRAGNELHSKPYRKSAPLSSLKIRIGELLLLLFIENGQPDGWQLFEASLRKFYEAKL